MKNQLGMLVAVAISLLGSVHRTEAKKVCYTDLGCFTSTTPFYIFLIPHFSLPASPKEIGTKFAIYTRENPEVQQSLSARSPKSIENSFFDGAKNTVFIIHGYISSGTEPWIKDMTKALLGVEDQNVVVVDWSKGGFHKYARAIANTRVVGAQIAFLIAQLEQFGEGSRSRVHLVGHSLGAHIAGFAGKLLAGLARITGLDPAGPGFDSNLNKMRLHHTDATYVDAIHTNADYVSLGMRRHVGDADFYPNGGKTQPRCEYDFICSHQVACLIFTESILNYPLVLEGKPCATLKDFEDGECEECKEGCNPMGFFSTKPAQRTTYYLDTERRNPLYKQIVDGTSNYMMENVYSYFGWSYSVKKDEDYSGGGNKAAPVSAPTEESLINRIYEWWQDEDDDDEIDFTAYITDFISYWSKGDTNQDATKAGTAKFTSTVPVTKAEKEGGSIFGSIWNWLSGAEEDNDEGNFEATTASMKMVPTTQPTTATTNEATTKISDGEKEESSFYLNLMGWLYSAKKPQTTKIVSATATTTTLATATTTQQSYWNYLKGIIG